MTLNYLDFKLRYIQMTNRLTVIKKLDSAATPTAGSKRENLKPRHLRKQEARDAAKRAK